MTLPSNTSIAFSQVNTELGRTANQALSLNDAAVRNLAGAPGGAISMSQLWGKANITFSPSPGSYAYGGGSYQAEADVSVSQTVVWTYSISGTSVTASASSGSSGTAISFTLTGGSVTKPIARSATVSLTATYNGNAYHWSFSLATGS